MAVEAEAPLDHRGRIVWAVIWMIGAIVSFTAMAVAGRAASRGMDALQISVWRTLIGLVILTAIVKAQGLAFSGLTSSLFC
jgi:hypothetical protein